MDTNEPARPDYIGTGGVEDKVISKEKFGYQDLPAVRQAGLLNNCACN